MQDKKGIQELGGWFQVGNPVGELQPQGHGEGEVHKLEPYGGNARTGSLGTGPEVDQSIYVHDTREGGGLRSAGTR